MGGGAASVAWGSRPLAPRPFRHTSQLCLSPSRAPRPPALLLHPQLAVSLSELYVTWRLSRSSGGGPSSHFLSAQHLPGSLLKLLSFFGGQMPSILFSPQGTLLAWRKAERLFTSLTGACFQFSHSCDTFQKGDGSRDRWFRSDYFKPQSHKNGSKITQSSRGQMRSRAAGLGESLTPGPRSR